MDSEGVRFPRVALSDECQNLADDASGDITLSEITPLYLGVKLTGEGL